MKEFDSCLLSDPFNINLQISQWYQMYFSSPNANSSSGKREEVETRTPGGAIKLQVFSPPSFMSSFFSSTH